MILLEFLSSKYHGERGRVRWPARGGQLGLAAVSLLIVGHNQEHFFSKTFFIYSGVGKLKLF
jgi:hypothetical protein